jgi:CRP-like cAMP-binding protein
MVQSSSPSPQSRVFKRGDFIYRAGEPVTHIYLIQSGLASVTVTRGNKKIEIAQVIAPQLLGEEALWGSVCWETSAVANNDVRAVPVEIATARTLFTSGSPLVQLYAKSIVHKQQAWVDSILQIKLESDPTPCAPDRVVKLFATIYHVASYTGTQKKGATVVVWPTFKKYSQRTFLESPVRLEQAVNILVKLGYAEHEMIPCETDPEAPDELGFVHFKDLDRVKKFFEFYRGQHFSGSGGLTPKPDEANLAILQEIEIWNAKGKVELKAA